MGQASSRAAPDSRNRNSNRTRPTSWAPPPPASASASESTDNSNRPHAFRRASSSHLLNDIRSFNPFARHGSTDAARSAVPEPETSNRLDSPDGVAIASANTSASDLRRRPSRMTRARSSLSTLPSLIHRRRLSRLGLDEQDDGSAERARPRPRLDLFRHRHATSPSFDRSPVLPDIQVPPELNVDLDIPADNTPPTSSAAQASINASSQPALSPRPRDGRPLSALPSFRSDRGIRSMTSQLRRRRSPLRREEDQAAMLSRLLSVAAAATAASLMGDDHQAVSEARNVAGDGEDGTFDSFLQALQNGRIASALRQSANGGGEEGDESAGTSLNFFRMFRFGSSPATPQPEANDNQTQPQPGQGEQEGGDERMVPIIIVGIRSINPGGTSGQQDDNIPPFLDALSSFPTPTATPGEEAMDGMLRPPSNTSRFSHRRRASMGGVNNHSSGYDNQRYRTARPRPWSALSDFSAGSARSAAPTPSDVGMAPLPAGPSTHTATEISPAPAVQQPTAQSSTPSRRGSFMRRATGSNLETTTEEAPTSRRTPRQRRLSESDFTRFGSGSARRNGVVEPDNNPGEGSRSWIIYVLGGSYPENHPILTTPSLFTDSPSYEDMIMLSNLLGPAKPPVATEEDVAAAAHGVYKISVRAGNLVAEAEGGTDIIVLPNDEACRICLSEFKADEEVPVRRLAKCGHWFHRPCVDTVS